MVHITTWEDHLHHLRIVLLILREAGLTAKPSKCQYGMQQCVYLGFIVGGGVVKPEVDKLMAIQQLPIPMVKCDVRAFLGITGYYRRFIANYATVATSLTDLTRSLAHIVHIVIIPIYLKKAAFCKGHPCNKCFDVSSNFV